MTAIANQHDRSRFPEMSDEQMTTFAEIGETLNLADGEEFVTEGIQQDGFFVIKQGRAQISKQAVGGASILRIHTPREFVGELSTLTGEASPFTARAVGPTQVIRLTMEQFRLVLASCPELASTVIPAMSRRVHDVESMLLDRDKLAALGKLAAGLTHELNNPVAAGIRAMSGVRGHLDQMNEYAITLGASGFSVDEIEEIRVQLRRASQALESPQEWDPIELSDQEEAIAEWLIVRGCTAPWSHAPVLVRGGYDCAALDEISHRIDGNSMARVMEFVASRIEVESMLRDAERSLVRVSDIVRAVKSYSRMDAAPIAEANLNLGIEDTLTMLAYPLRGVNLVKQLEPNIPTICAYASELNQVWTNLIDNAISAMGEGGTLTIRTRREGEDYVVVEIADTGPGIPLDIQEKIFDPFFTTKPVGEGTGLGLDIVKRIITVRHGGEITFETSPSGTTFRIRLPILQA